MNKWTTKDQAELDRLTQKKLNVDREYQKSYLITLLDEIKESIEDNSENILDINIELLREEPYISGTPILVTGRRVTVTYLK